MASYQRSTPHQRSELLRRSTTALVVAGFTGAAATGALAAVLYAQDHSWGSTSSNPSGGSGSVQGNGLSQAPQGLPQVLPQGGSNGS